MHVMLKMVHETYTKLMYRPTDSGIESTGKALRVVVVDINSERTTFHKLNLCYSRVHSCGFALYRPACHTVGL